MPLSTIRGIRDEALNGGKKARARGRPQTLSNGEEQKVESLMEGTRAAGPFQYQVTGSWGSGIGQGFRNLFARD